MEKIFVVVGVVLIVALGLLNLLQQEVIQEQAQALLASEQRADFWEAAFKHLYGYARLGDWKAAEQCRELALASADLSLAARHRGWSPEEEKIRWQFFIAPRLALVLSGEEEK